MKNEYYTVQKYSVISRREDNLLILFPEIPFWIATTKDGEEFLKHLNGLETVWEITEKVLGPGCEEIAEEFLTPLIESQAIKPIGDSAKKYNSITEGIIKPDKITLLQTMRCNLRCKHCCVPMESLNTTVKELDLEETKKALINISKIMTNNKRLAFLGGEPLMRSDFLDVAEFAHEIGFTDLGISTNAILIDEKFAQKAKDLNISVQISVDGPTKESHEFIRGVGTWDKVMKAIGILKKYDVKMKLNMVFYKGNINLIPDYISLGRHLQIKDLRLIPLINMGRAKENLESSSVDEMVDAIIEMIKKEPEVIHYLYDTNFIGLVMNARISNRLVSCGSGVITLILDPHGDVYPCLNTYGDNFKICNVFDENFENNFWESPIHKVFSSRRIDKMNKICALCDFRYMCGGLCRGETFSVTGDLEAPYPYCNSWKNAMIKIFWLLVDYPNLGREKSENILKGVRHFSLNC